MTLKVTINKLKNRRQLFRVYLLRFLLVLLAITSLYTGLYLLNDLEKAVLGVFIMVLFTILWFYISNKKYLNITKNTGQIEIDKTQIKIIEGDNSRFLSLSEIADLRIYFHSYKGMSVGRVEFDGDLNRISFINNKDKEEYQFNLDSLAHFEELNLLFAEFYENGVKFKEYHWDRRSYLLKTSLTYNEIQKFKEEHKIEWI